MAQIIRHTAVWTGVPGLPGYSQFYQEVTGTIPGLAQGGHGSVRGFFNELLTLIPADITVTVDPVYQVVDAATGEIVSEGTVATPSAAVVGGYVGNWSGQVGVLVEWLTESFIAGRRLRGRTYLVPLGNVSDDDGTLPGGTVSTIAAGIVFIAAGGYQFVVWHRPKGAEPGSIATITTATVRDHAAVLRSRRI